MTNGYDHKKAESAQDQQDEKPRAKESAVSKASSDQQESTKPPNKNQ